MASDFGVSNCYVFKSRLQEYAQKVGITTPVYETVREGSPHQPLFSSTVIVDDKRYSSLPGFTKSKAAEQSAAEIALIELSTSGLMKETISAPVHETGLCKNLLQEYSLKMNFAIPVYSCEHFETPGRQTCFTCTVEVGGMKYVGGIAGTKREAEIKAARTALLAIQITRIPVEETPSHLTVIPPIRKIVEKTKKTKKSAHKKKPWKKQKSVKAVAGNGEVSNSHGNQQNSSNDGIKDDPHCEKRSDLFLRACVEGQGNPSRPVNYSSVNNELEVGHGGNNASESVGS